MSYTQKWRNRMKKYDRVMDKNYVYYQILGFSKGAVHVVTLDDRVGKSFPKSELYPVDWDLSIGLAS